MSVIVYQFQTIRFIQMMSLTIGLFTQVSGSGPLGPLVIISHYVACKDYHNMNTVMADHFYAQLW